MCSLIECTGLKEYLNSMSFPPFLFEIVELSFKSAIASRPDETVADRHPPPLCCRSLLPCAIPSIRCRPGQIRIFLLVTSDFSGRNGHVLWENIFGIHLK